ncbi:MAG: bifunctional glutamate N-acetyltransferase/amino-acid acetyltransferase ArgJ [Clostridia bacterium]|nr:bifunctional glutamate N-acetyltransferase/amino-acid acetyltransferase ArgJ [Clostridia bacterium]
MYKEIENSVCAPKGFTAAGMHCGLKKNKNKKDLALIYCDKICTAAGVYTTNAVKGAPVTVTKENLKNGLAQAVICNSRNANTCNKDGEEKAKLMCSLIAEKLNINESDVIVASTGVIGQTLPIEPIKNSCGELVSKLSKTGANDAAQSIMTTDLFTKEAAVEVALKDNTLVKIGAIAKGSGMIHPNMATMLCFVTTDINISSQMLAKALKYASDDTFNMLSVDGDTSTNDMLTVLASGQAGNNIIEEENDDYKVFCEALKFVCRKMTVLMAKDGEGATKLVVCKVSGAENKKIAKCVARAVISSNLVKTAMFGEDANWGRILCAIGYGYNEVDVSKIDVLLSSENGKVDVCQNGYGVEFSEEIAKEVLSSDEIDININLKAGNSYAEAFGCDLTYDYVKINGDYRT